MIAQRNLEKWKDSKIPTGSKKSQFMHLISGKTLKVRISISTALSAPTGHLVSARAVEQHERQWRHGSSEAAEKIW